MNVYLVLSAIAVFFTVTCVVLFGDSPSLRNTFIHTLRLNILQTFKSASNYLSRLDARSNGRLSWALGWTVPVFYVFVITFCLYLFFTETYPKVLPSEITGSALHNLYIFVSIVCIYALTLMVIYSDPGIIRSEEDATSAAARAPYNDLIFFPGKQCHTCKTTKPARSKHCSTCGHCVMVFDHHCIWLNNCIGYYNYKWFVAYLVTNINFLFYGGVLSFRGLRNVKYRHSGDDPANAHWAALSWWRLITTTTYEAKITGIFVILCFLFVIITTGFLCLHLRYVYLGVTTNELDKWSELEYLVELGTLYRVQRDGSYVEKGMFYDKSKNVYVSAYISLKDESVLFTDADAPELIRVASVEADLHNIYDRGFAANLRERILTPMGGYTL